MASEVATDLINLAGATCQIAGKFPKFPLETVLIHQASKADRSNKSHRHVQIPDGNQSYVD